MKRVVKNGQNGSRQSYQNKVKYNPNKYKLEKERIPQQILQTMSSLCCDRCCQILQWKVDYGKYVLLQKPRKCNRCGEIAVNIAYHRICQGCALREGRCAKCQKIPKQRPAPQEGEEGVSGDDDMDEEDGDENDALQAEMEDQDDLENKRDADGRPESLKYLNTAYVDRLEARKKKEEELNEIGRLRERDRRTALRKKREEKLNKGEDQEDLSDDSDEIL